VKTSGATSLAPFALRQLFDRFAASLFSFKVGVSVRGFFQPPTSNLQLLAFPGGHTAGATPVPIPNTEVKPRRADDTARVTVWERRSLPGLNLKRPAGSARWPFFYVLTAVETAVFRLPETACSRETTLNNAGRGACCIPNVPAGRSFAVGHL
jgi:hypothetical protein